MFRLFKKKSEIEKLQMKYKQLSQRSFELSRINRKEGDRVFAEAQDILDEIALLQKV